QGWPFAACLLEWRWSERTRSEAQGRMQGQALLVPFGGAGHPGDCQKGPAQRGGTNARSNSETIRASSLEVTRGKGFAVFHPTLRRISQSAHTTHPAPA